MWKDLNQRKDQLYKQLLLLAAGHPSQDVATAADELGLALLWVAQQTQFAVWELLAHRDFVRLVEAAMKRYETAQAALGRLTRATKDAAIPRRRGFRRPSRAELEGPPPPTQSSP